MEQDVIDLFREEEYLLLRAHTNFPASTECADSQTKEITMSNPVRPIPEGYHSITPAITCKNASKAIDFYKNALGASEIMRMQGPGGMVTHAELRIGDSVIFVSDEFPGMAVAPSGSGPASSYLFLYTDNVDTVFNRAVSAGCHVDMPLDNMFWGDRYGKVTDPFGHHWGLAQHVEDVAPEEMKRRSAEWSAKMAKAAGQS
jgi:PhnB protein